MAKAKKNSPTITHIRFSHSKNGSVAGGCEDNIYLGHPDLHLQTNPNPFVKSYSVSLMNTMKICMRSMFILKLLKYK